MKTQLTEAQYNALTKVIALDTLEECGVRDGVPYHHEHARPGDVGVICLDFVDVAGEVTCFWERTGTITTCDEISVSRVGAESVRA